LNYGVDYQDGRKTYFDPIPDTWNKMFEILSFWASKGVDGFRCDMAEMVPVEFWHWVVKKIKADYPEIVFIAEIYNPNQYENYIHKGGFDYLYDKVQFYDTVRHIMEGHGNTNNIPGVMDFFNGERNIDQNMLRFLENHDEQRIASKYFTGNAKVGAPAMLVSAAIGNGPVMIYFGQEVGEPGAGKEGFGGDDGRTTIFDYWGVPEFQKWTNGGKYDGAKLSKGQVELRAAYAEILKLCSSEPAFYEGKYYDLNIYNKENGGFNSDKVYSFVKKSESQALLVVANFSGQTFNAAKIKLPGNVVPLNPNSSVSFLTLKGQKLGAKVMEKEGIEIDIPPYAYIVLEVKVNA